jgi:hypothetical protein
VDPGSHSPRPRFGVRELYIITSMRSFVAVAGCELEKLETTTDRFNIVPARTSITRHVRDWGDVVYLHYPALGLTVTARAAQTTPGEVEAAVTVRWQHTAWCFFGTPHQGSKMAGFIDCITQAGIAYDPTVSTPRGGSFGPTSTNSSSSSVKATAFGASMQGNRKQQERNWSLVDPFQSTNLSPTTDPHTRPQREALLDVTNTWKSRTLKLLLSLLG